MALAGRVAAATCRWLLLVAEFDARDGADRYGLASTARWLSHHCGISHRTAQEHVRVARTLAAHPVLAESMSAGRISYSHARAISRVAQPEEHDLVLELVTLAEYVPYWLASSPAGAQGGSWSRWCADCAASTTSSPTPSSNAPDRPARPCPPGRSRIPGGA